MEVEIVCMLNLTIDTFEEYLLTAYLSEKHRCILLKRGMSIVPYVATCR